VVPCMYSCDQGSDPNGDFLTPHPPLIGLGNAIDQPRVLYSGTRGIKLHPHTAIRLLPDIPGDMNTIARALYNASATVLAGDPNPLVRKCPDGCRP